MTGGKPLPSRLPSCCTSQAPPKYRAMSTKLSYPTHPTTISMSDNMKMTAIVIISAPSAAVNVWVMATRRSSGTRKFTRSTRARMPILTMLLPKSYRLPGPVIPPEKH